MSPKPKSRPVVLCVLDGWGERDETADNAIALARTPAFDRLRETCPRATLATNGHDVGLPDGQMGNSEVGHLNLGAGRVVNQEIRRIDAAIADGSFAGNPALADFTARLKSSGGTCHLLGLVSPGGVHSHQNQIVALARAIDDAGIPVAIHAFLDGRDTPPSSAAGYMAEFLAALDGAPSIRVATVCGRYYAMDRDQRWERVAQAYALLTDAVGSRADDPVSAIRAAYDLGTTDEFVLPAAIGDYAGMADGDGVVMANFRADRAREILAALLDPGFGGFERARRIDFAAALGLVQYSDPLNAFHSVMFPPLELTRLLGEIVSEAGLRQLRIAETEKYAHVTFFFNGGSETPFPGEERVLIPSPKVATYDLAPAMSAREVTDRLVREIDSGKYGFILVNYANPDMVGHTGVLDAAVSAIEAVDSCLGELADAVHRAGGTLLITADHGNAEMMRDPVTGEPHTAHTMNRVPLLLCNPPDGVAAIGAGSLRDVAPTVLALMGLDQPGEMTGSSLVAARAPA